MNQSNLIFGCIFVAFIVFITMRGKLPKYLEALIGTNQAASTTNSNSNRGGSGGSATDNATNSLLGQIPYVGGVLSGIGSAASTVRNGVLDAIGIPHF